MIACKYPDSYSQTPLTHAIHFRNNFVSTWHFLEQEDVDEVRKSITSNDNTEILRALFVYELYSVTMRLRTALNRIMCSSCW